MAYPLHECSEWYDRCCVATSLVAVVLAAHLLTRRGGGGAGHASFLAAALASLVFRTTRAAFGRRACLDALWRADLAFGLLALSTGPFILGRNGRCLIGASGLAMAASWAAYYGDRPGARTESEVLQLTGHFLAVGTLLAECA